MARLRIIAGKFGGRFLRAPAQQATHPMGERVRGALFNTLGLRIHGAYVLDAFAGSGAIGLEALSRGAMQATFIEQDRMTQRIIAENIAALGVYEQSIVINTTVNNWLQTQSLTEGFDIIVADPPYHRPQFSTVKLLMNLLKPGGTMVLSHPGIGEVPIQNGIVVVDNRSYGGAHLTYLRRC